MIYSLNIADWICTLTLLRTGGFYEANPLMRPIMGDVSLGFLVKCLMPVPIIFLIRRLYSDFDRHDLMRVDRFVSFVLALYTALGAVHIVNFMLWHFGAIM